jgi:hypothetical protein
MFGGALTWPMGLLGQDPHLLSGWHISADAHPLPRSQSASAASPLLNACIARAGAPASWFRAGLGLV